MGTYPRSYQEGQNPGGAAFLEIPQNGTQQEDVDHANEVFPPSPRDAKIGGRLDLGNPVEDGTKRRIHFQVNKNAENPTLKAMAAKDSHAVHAATDVDISQEPTEAKPPQNEENDLDIQEEELKKSSVFEPTSAFRRKAGVRLNSEERRLVGVQNEGSLSTKPTKEGKKRRRPKAADWDDEFPGLTSEVENVKKIFEELKKQIKS